MTTPKTFINPGVGVAVSDSMLDAANLNSHTNAIKEIQGTAGISWGTAAPTTGTYLRGAIVFNSEPSSGGPPGWQCTVAGTPGTWKAMANLA